jgi:hypothetical protein
MPARIVAPPASWAGPNASWNVTAPVSAPTSGSRFTNVLASSAGTRACAQANSQNASAVPASPSPTTAATGPAADGAGGAPSSSAATGSAASAPAPSWTAVIAAGSRPCNDERCRSGHRGEHEEIAGD